MKEEIRAFACQLGVDAVGFAAAADYHSPQSPPLETLLPGARAMVVMAYRELSSCDSANPQLAMNGRLDLMEFSRSCNYQLARYLEGHCGGQAMTVPVSYPLEMSEETKGAVGDVSLRHAAVAAGLGALGRHNLVLNQTLGSRVIFSAVLTNLELASDPAVPENPCTQCDACVRACPSQALDEAGRTDVMRCIRKSQPYGIGGAIRFWSEYGAASAAERKALLRDPRYWRLYQAGFIGFQYFCFRCLAACPVGRG